MKMGGDFFVGELNVAVGDTVPVALTLEDQSYFALVMNEQLWSESEDTAKGRMEHDRVHDPR